MKIKLLICTVAAALLAGGLITNNAFAANDSAAPAHGGLIKRMADKLNLTTDQRQQIKAAFAGEKDTQAIACRAA